eukprot:594327-Pleurochrysis_carterae.AAC.4
MRMRMRRDGCYAHVDAISRTTCPLVSRASIFNTSLLNTSLLSESLSVHFLPKRHRNRSGTFSARSKGKAAHLCRERLGARHLRAAVSVRGDSIDHRVVEDDVRLDPADEAGRFRFVSAACICTNTFLPSSVV